jgi:hypothetical protein
VLGVHGKLVKYVVHLSKRKIAKNLFFFTQAAQTAIDQFLVSRNFRGYKNRPHRLQNYSISSEMNNFFEPCKTRSTNFESSWLKTFVLHKVTLDIMLRNQVKNPKYLHFIP